MPRLSVRAVAAAVSAIAFWWLLLFDIPAFFDGFPARQAGGDFSHYYVAAEIGTQFGWSRIFDLGLQHRLYDAIGVAHVAFSSLTEFVNPPPVAWLVVPLLGLGVTGAYAVWLATLAVAMLVTCVAIAPGRPLTRAAAVLVSLSVHPVMFAFVMGQVSVFIAAAAGLTPMLLRRRWAAPAGALLALTACLKPQDALLLPVALAVTAPRRALAAFAATAGALLALTSVAIGPSGVRQYIEALAGQQGLRSNIVFTLATIVPVWAVLPLGLLCATAAVFAIWRERRSVELPFAAALLGSILLSPYLHEGDFAVLVVAALLHLRARPDAPHWALFGLGALAAEVLPRTSVPFVGFELVWLGVMLWDAKPAALRVPWFARGTPRPAAAGDEAGGLG